jgi:hypothetical protein
MADVTKATATFEGNIERQTGKSVADWATLANAQNLGRHSDIVSWLKEQHGLSHSHANHVAKRALQSEETEAQAVDRLFSGHKQALRPIYDSIAASIRAIGNDASFAPKKANISVRRKKQFALVQPTTRTRVDLGLILKNESTGGRIEAGASFNPMFTHRIRIESAEEVDAELKALLKKAYDQAG